MNRTVLLIALGMVGLVSIAAACLAGHTDLPGGPSSGQPSSLAEYEAIVDSSVVAWSSQSVQSMDQPIGDESTYSPQDVTNGYRALLVGLVAPYVADTDSGRVIAPEYVYSSYSLLELLGGMSWASRNDLFFQSDAFELDSYMAESFGRFLDKKAAQASTDGLNQPEELTRISEWVNAITNNPEGAHGLPIPLGGVPAADHPLMRQALSETLARRVALLEDGDPASGSSRRRSR